MILNEDFFRYLQIKEYYIKHIKTNGDKIHIIIKMSYISLLVRLFPKLYIFVWWNLEKRQLYILRSNGSESWMKKSQMRYCMICGKYIKLKHNHRFDILWKLELQENNKQTNKQNTRNQTIHIRISLLLERKPLLRICSRLKHQAINSGWIL